MESQESMNSNLSDISSAKDDLVALGVHDGDEDSLVVKSRRKKDEEDWWHTFKLLQETLILLFSLKMSYYTMSHSLSQQKPLIPETFLLEKLRLREKEKMWLLQPFQSGRRWKPSIHGRIRVEVCLEDNELEKLSKSQGNEIDRRNIWIKYLAGIHGLEIGGEMNLVAGNAGNQWWRRSAAGAEADDNRFELLLSGVEGKDVTELITAGQGWSASYWITWAHSRRCMH